MLKIEENPIIAAVRSEAEFENACKSGVAVVFVLSTDIFNIEKQVMLAHESKKSIFVHADMMDGLGKDRTGMEYLARCGVDGIISTRSAIIRSAAAAGLHTIQRFFLVDSQSVETAKNSILGFKPDMVEIMPFQCAEFLASFCVKMSVPLIAGGLVRDKKDIFHALEKGAEAVSTGNEKLWDE